VKAHPPPTSGSKRRRPLFEGHADQIATGLLQAVQKHPTVADGLRREAGYFRHNQARMQYQELREDGFPIGSGMVESGCNAFARVSSALACAGVGLALSD